MKKLLALCILYFVRFTLWFRYRVTVKGLDKLNRSTIQKPGGVLFLPNHPTVFVDPTLVTLAIWKKFPIRPIIVEYMYYLPGVNWMMRFMDALPVPNFVSTSNSLKKKKADQVFETIMDRLRKRDNFLIYPAGKVKHQAREVISASGVHRIIQEVPEVNIVLVRTTGLWGSSFSRALTGQTPAMFPTIFRGIKMALKNLIFFTPRREVTIEFVPAPTDFPYDCSRLELNRYLEKWYNRPDGLTKTNEEEPGESLYLVSYSMWKEELPTVKAITLDKELIVSKIPDEIQMAIKTKLSEMAHTPIAQITPELSLGSDLGLDSLDNAELLAFLDERYDITGIPVGELTTVSKLMAIAAKQIAFGEQVEEEQEDLSKWTETRPSKEIGTIASGNTIQEVFLNNCARMGKQVACGDARAGVMTYSQAKMRVILLAEAIKKMPGKYVGILLPSSVAAYFTILACQLAGKTPLMINWTVGPRHLETVVALSQVKTVISSWAFLDRLENINLNGIEDSIVTLEDMRRGFGLKEKLKAFYRSKLSTSAILKIFNVQHVTSDDEAVLLFTSGTESMPKGVPLTHNNILSNQRDAVKEAGIFTDDVLLGILPPFHAFGFTVSGLIPLLSGVRVAYYPDPTDGKGLAHSVEKWKATLICGAPTFLKGMLKNGSKEQLKTLRLCVTGAEKAPVELFEMVKQLHQCKLIEGYGITECSPIITINKNGDPAKGVGQPMPSIELSVVDIDKHHKLPQGERGLILVKGPNVFNGYLNKGLSSPFIEMNGERWYSTGDLGHIDKDGNLIISGRLKRFVKIGGEMVSLTAVEEALQNSIGQKVKELQEEGPVLAVCAKEELGEKTRLYLFTRFSTTVDEANRSLRTAGFGNLIKITKVIEIPEIPLMGTGKIHYRALDGQIPVNNNHSPQTEFSKV